MDNFDIPSHKHHRRLCRFIGIAIQEGSVKLLRHTSFVIFLTALAIILHTYILLTSKFETLLMMELMTTYLPTICFTACHYNVLYNFKMIKIILGRLTTDVYKLENEEEFKVMNKYGEQSKSFSLIIAYIFYLYVGFLFMPSMQSLYLFVFGVHNDTILILPVPIEYFLKTRNRYFFMLLLEYVGISLICTVGIAYYTMVITCLQHACALFTIITVKIDRSLKENVHNFRFMSSVTRRRKESEWIISVIKYYNDAIDFVDLLLAIGKRSYCVEIVMAVLFFIIDFLYIFRFLDMVMTRNEVIANSIYVIGTITMIYAAFYMGQRLIDHSNNVHAKCCQIPFYALSIKTQKLLMMLIIRTLKPCSMNINGMMVTSHEVFAKIANTSYSMAILCYGIR